MLAKIAQWWSTLSPADLMWLLVGLAGQAMFSARWIVQWLATERQRRSTVPQLFWYLSFVGGLLVFCYGLYRLDPVIIIGQFGVFIYARNLFFVRQERKDGLKADLKSDAVRA